MEPKHPRWVDKPEFEWTPETPLRFEPSASGENPADSVIIDAQAPEPWARPSTLDPANDPLPHPANHNSARPAFAPRLAVGIGQGLLLAALFYCRDHNLWPGDGVLAALIMPLTFAPMLLVQGLGRIATRPLLIWTLCAALGLAGLGLYHHWRIQGADADHSGLWLAGLVALFLLIGQSLLLGHSRSGPGPVRYAVLYESSWRLVIEVALCGIAALLVWGVWSVGEGPLRATSWLLSHLGLPLVTVSLAVAAQLRPGRTLHLLKRGAVMAFTSALPVAILLATFTILFDGLTRWRTPFAICGLEGLLLVVAINASYRSGGEWRPQWRRRSEFTGAFLLLPLAVLAAVALQARIAAFGFTAPRIVAVAALLLLSAYALTYAGAALISLGGGRWMERIESANLLMAFVALSLIATLVSPLGDPVRLAVASQTWRVVHSRVAPDAFDYAYLRNSGLRFGHDALARMAKDQRMPAVARGAFLALIAGPSSDLAAPTEIGANIRVMTPGAVLPAGLLARDWSQAGADVPPCLTTAHLVCDAYFLDLDRDGRDEILLGYGDDAVWWAGVLRQGTGGGWYLAGTIASPPNAGALSALRAGQFTVTDPLPGWRELMVNGQRLAVSRIAPAPAKP